jgi:FkbH-like protein
MRLVDALRILRQPAAQAEPFEIEMVCGFTPLHLETFLAAHVQLLLPEGSRVATRSGLFGDLAGNLRRLAQQEGVAAAVLVEWSDLDPRLGLRNLGGWGPDAVDDILAHAEAKANEYGELIRQLPRGVQLAVSLPTLPLPPVDTVPGWQSGVFELSLRSVAARLGVAAARRPNARVVNPQWIDRVSPMSQRFDARSEIIGGFPYTASHAVALAGQLARLLVKRTPMKGIITDLDDTLWNGIVGEVGPDQVHWDLDNKSLLHGLYQQTLKALAAQGTLVAVASKNDQAVVDRAFEREDIVLPKERVFPMEVHWGPKSGSVARILSKWNIGPDAVVFIDDNAAELAEVKQAHPQIETILFPKNNPQAAVELIEKLRDLFGKEVVSDEDRFRLDSLRAAGEAMDGVEPGQVSETFLETAEAEIRMIYRKDGDDPRPLELVNKTNQFNLNGLRITETAWRERLNRPETVLQVVNYSDKFGPLGKIGVLLGTRQGDTVTVDAWVLSCRAFSRRIEFQCLNQLFACEGVQRLRFAFEATAKNGPLQSLLGHFFAGPLKPGLELTAAEFAAKAPKLYHRVSSEN